MVKGRKHGSFQQGEYWWQETKPLKLSVGPSPRVCGTADHQHLWVLGRGGLLCAAALPTQDPLGSAAARSQHPVLPNYCMCVDRAL